MRSFACLLTLSLAACGGSATDDGPRAADKAADTATTATPEATSLLGAPLVPALHAPERLAELTANIESARTAHAASPEESTLI